MKNLKITGWYGSALFVVLFTTPLWVGAADEGKRPVVKSELTRIEATVVSIDYKTREVVLDGKNGPVSLIVSPEAPNLEKVRAGDKVVVKYYQGLSAQLSRLAAGTTVPAASAFAVPKDGGKWPGGMVGASVTGTVTVEDVDVTTNTIAIRHADGEVYIVPVKSPDMQKFIRDLKRGDKVDITYTESVAIDVEMKGQPK